MTRETPPSQPTPTPHSATDKLELAALVLARDASHHLPECLNTLAWCDWVVVVVDPASLDDTETVARRLTPHVLVRPFDDFASQRNAGRELALRLGARWILAVDADERVSPQLAAEIQRRLATPPLKTHGSKQPVGYRVPIRSRVLGRQFVASGTQDDQPLRLFRLDSGRWIGAVHETVALNGPHAVLRHPLSHETLETLSVFLTKINRYTCLGAEHRRQLGETFCLSRFLLRPVWVFTRLWLGKSGWRDGWEGFLFCWLSAVSAAIEEARLREPPVSPANPRPQLDHPRLFPLIPHETIRHECRSNSQARSSVA